MNSNQNSSSIDQPKPTIAMVVGEPDFDPQPGDVVFGNRNNFVHRLGRLIGGVWTHVGVVATDEHGELITVEVSRKGCVTRPLQQFLNSYKINGFARPDMSPACKHAIAKWASSQLGRERHQYSFGLLGMAGFAALIRTYTPIALRPSVESGTRRIARRRAEKPGSICSSFVWDVLNRACESCRPKVSWPLLDAMPPWRRPGRVDLVRRIVPARRSFRSEAASSDATRPTGLLMSPTAIWSMDFFSVRTLFDRHAPVRIVSRVGRRAHDVGVCEDIPERSAPA